MQAMEAEHTAQQPPLSVQIKLPLLPGQLPQLVLQSQELHLIQLQRISPQPVRLGQSAHILRTQRMDLVVIKDSADQTLRDRPNGFTLIELLVAIVILAVVFTVVITSTSLVRKNARDAQRQSDLRALQSALEQYHADNAFYPSTSGGLNALVTKYMPSVPTDPSGSSWASYTYQAVQNPSGTDCTNATPLTSCIAFCLWTRVETVPSGYTNPSLCSTAPAGGYNYAITQP
jgi:general secretion pathway protein G